MCFDSVVRELDIHSLQSVLDVVTFSDFEQEDIASIPANAFLKVMRLAQLIIEYLLHVQKFLQRKRAQAEAEALQMKAAADQRVEEAVLKTRDYDRMKCV